MRRGKCPTRAQKAIIKANGLTIENWLVLEHLQHEHRLILAHRYMNYKRECLA
ncbi:hypothetical protein KH263_09430 [Bacillus velezensis]|uniref:DUF6906 family protein n=1 Tax=Bacillus velezensis TaxID=492670 RepID=UPI001BCC707E|nr:hypothetical protein [Bacillus velezensis]MCC9263432.1 hypothetical protein [Bacillus velezensis]QVL37797.1 hypothetical protein KH263_09430 [Bacillus velezensis]